jgi:hypothetical protein
VNCTVVGFIVCALAIGAPTAMSRHVQAMRDESG